MSTIPSLLKSANYVTLTGIIFGILALCCAAIGTFFLISLGYFFVFITIGTDLLDGYVARKTGTKDQLDKEIDSLSDSISFGIAPAILNFQAYKTGTAYDIILIIAMVIFAVCGILRLARFNISKDSGYTGVPIPLTGLLMILFYWANFLFAIPTMTAPWTEVTFPEFAYYLIPFLMIFAGWLNITTYISFGEKGKSIYYLAIVLGILCPTIMILGFLSKPDTTPMMGISIFLYFSVLILFIYLMFGFYQRYKQKDLKAET